MSPSAVLSCPAAALSVIPERGRRPGLLSVLLLALVLSFPAAPARASAADQFTLCVHPYLPAPEIEKRFGPLVAYLGRMLGAAVRLHITKDYHEHIELIGKDRVSLSFLGPASYVQLVEVYGEQRLLGRLETRGKPFFEGVIFVPLASPVRTLADLRGKRFAFGEPESTMSCLVPRSMLAKAGVTADLLSKCSFLSNHENVVLGVLMGDFDAGAVMEDVYLRNKSRGIRAIATTPPISEHVFVAARSLPPALIARIRRVLLGMKNSPEGRKALRSIKAQVTGIVQAQDGDYDDLRAILQELKTPGGAL